MWDRALHLVDKNSDWMNETTWVIVQIDPVEYSPQTLNNLVEFEQRKYGSTLLVFYERIAVEA
jgi:16S rRNA G966 N2-methylase RsmD